MISRITASEFHDAFRDAWRDNQFSYAGLNALYNYIAEYEESADTQIELDVIALCCEYTEYENLEAFHDEYDAEEYPRFSDIEYRTQVIYRGE